MNDQIEAFLTGILPVSNRLNILPHWCIFTWGAICVSLKTKRHMLHRVCWRSLMTYTPGNTIPDSKVHGANMGPIWVLLAQMGRMLAPRTLLSEMLFSDAPPGNIALHQTCWKSSIYIGNPAPRGIDGSIYTRSYTKAEHNSFLVVDFRNATWIWNVRLIE